MPPENAKQRAIKCPNCTHQFHLSANGGFPDQDGIQETISNKRKDYQYVTEQIKKVCLKNIFNKNLFIYLFLFQKQNSFNDD
jgi:hypothetical protein